MEKIKVLKLGWEFPPNHHGGLGVACEGIVRGLASHGVETLLELPHDPGREVGNCRFFTTQGEGGVKTTRISSLLLPYSTSEEYARRRASGQRGGIHIYGEQIFDEIERYAQVVQQLAETHQFDLIHAHDWMSIRAGRLAKKVSGKPLIFHVHSTEIDRTGGQCVNKAIYEIERAGMHAADMIIAVSRFTKDKIGHYYNIPSHKVAVVHNAVWPTRKRSLTKKQPITFPLILFLGRLTVQKGPDYFVRAAFEVLKHRPDATFVIAGSGNMEHQLIEWVASSGTADKVLFAGQLNSDEVMRAYQRADVYVMPSVSEPFGLTVLEAMQNGTPVIMSKQSGVSEVVTHALRIDFWDIHELVNKIIATIDHPELRTELSKNAHNEVQRMSWKTASKSCLNIYQQLL